MAEDYGVTLKITADTSDLDKIPQKVEETRKEVDAVSSPRVKEVDAVSSPRVVEVVEKRQPAAPVEHPAETVEVVEKRGETAAPVEHPAETVEVREKRVGARGEDSASTVEHPDETVEVKEEREPAAPVEHPDETAKVKEVREPAAPIEHPAETVEVRQDPDPLKPKVEQPAPVEVTVEQPKPVTVKSMFDGTAIGAGINMLHSLRAAANRVMAAFGLFGLAVNGVMAVVSGVKALHEWMNRAETKAKELREEMERTRYANAVAQAAASYDRLTESIAKANRLEKERNEILAARKQVERNLEDAQLEQSKQREISKLDPNAEDYAARRKEIERSYDIKASDAKAARADEDARANSTELYRAAKDKDKEADAIEREYRKQEKIVDTAVENKFQAGMAVRRGEAGADEKYKEAEKAFDEAAAKAEDIRKAMEAARAEAQSIRNRAAEQSGSNLAVRIQNEANKQRIENERKEEEARTAKESSEKAKRDADEQADFERERGKSAADNDFDSRFRAAQRRASAQGATEQQVNEAENTQLEMLRQRQQEAEEQVAEAEKALAEELRKDAKDRDEKRIARARADIREGEQVAAQSAQQREDLEQSIQNRRVAKQEDYFGNLAREIDSQRPQNRLTAMGLGSGDSAASAERQRIIGVLGQILEATRQNRPAPAQPTPATFTY